MRFAGARTVEGALRRLVWNRVADRVGRRRLSLALGGPSRAVLVARAFARDMLSSDPRASAPPPVVAAAPSQWVDLQQSLSEWGRSTFSDNLVSNEDSMLDVAPQLERAPRGGAYIGVGPEQNFTYLAIQRPSLAFVVDVRKDNARLHWLYRALFEEASSRAEWLALLLGQRWEPEGDDSDVASLESVLAALERRRPDEASFRASHGRLLVRLAEAGLPLPRFELRALEAIHRRFFKEQLDITFQLRTRSKQRYPSLRSLLVSRAPDGARGGFLSAASDFDVVQRLQRQGRVVPVVGDLTGDHAMRMVARELERRGLGVGMLYVSNVEQYIFEDRRWRQWMGNLARLPLERDAVIVRSYLDQGRPHPRQRAPHRTTNMVHSAHAFLERDRARAYESFWEVVTDGAIECGAGGGSAPS